MLVWGHNSLDLERVWRKQHPVARVYAAAFEHLQV